jgi:hypothetical protein
MADYAQPTALHEFLEEPKEIITNFLKVSKWLKKWETINERYRIGKYRSGKIFPDPANYFNPGASCAVYNPDDRLQHPGLLFCHQPF